METLNTSLRALAALITTVIAITVITVAFYLAMDIGHKKEAEVEVAQNTASYIELLNLENYGKPVPMPLIYYTLYEYQDYVGEYYFYPEGGDTLNYNIVDIRDIDKFKDYFSGKYYVYFTKSSTSWAPYDIYISLTKKVVP